MTIREQLFRPATLGGIAVGLVVAVASAGIAVASTSGGDGPADGIVVEAVSAEPDTRALVSGHYVYTLAAHPDNPSQDPVEVRIEVRDAGTFRCVDVVSNAERGSSAGSCGEGDLEGVTLMIVGSVSVDDYGWMAIFGIVKDPAAASIRLRLTDDTEEITHVEGRVFLTARPSSGDEHHYLAIAGYEARDSSGRVVESEVFDLGDFGKTEPGADERVAEDDHTH